MGDLSIVTAEKSQPAMRSAVRSVAFARSRSCAFIGISSMRRKSSAVETESAAGVDAESAKALGFIVVPCQEL